MTFDLKNRDLLILLDLTAEQIRYLRDLTRDRKLAGKVVMVAKLTDLI